MSPWKRTMCQCEIVKNSTGVFLRDKSSNGTWVNGNKMVATLCYPVLDLHRVAIKRGGGGQGLRRRPT